MSVVKLNSTLTYLIQRDDEYPEFTNPTITIQIYQIGYTLTFLFGFIGNIFSLLTFSRAILRKVSTGCLFLALATSDMFVLFSYVFDYLEFGFKVSFYPKLAYAELCRFRTLIMYGAQLLSAWILVIVSIDRWIRTRFPFKSASICTPTKALITVGILIIITIGLHAHILTPMFGTLVPGFANGACGPDFNRYNAYAKFYYIKWSIIQIFTNCLLPVIIMLITVIDTVIQVQSRKRTVVQTTQNIFTHQNNQRQTQLQKQMFILMFVSICIFFLTNLPLTLYKIIASLTSKNLEAEAIGFSINWTALGWVQSLNYAMNFYMHCLTSTLFRKEFRDRMKSLMGCHRTNIGGDVRGAQHTITRTLPAH